MNDFSQILIDEARRQIQDNTLFQTYDKKYSGKTLVGFKNSDDILAEYKLRVFIQDDVIKIELQNQGHGYSPKRDITDFETWLNTSQEFYVWQIRE
jgi:hypothetical protein